MPRTPRTRSCLQVRASGVVSAHPCFCVATRTAQRAAAQGGSGPCHGLVIISLTKTPLDADASLRIYATLDDALQRLATKLRLSSFLPTDAEVIKEKL